jgi:HEAT repeat protein
VTGLFRPRPLAHDIGTLKITGDIQALIRLLNHPDKDIREQAIEALGALGQNALPALVTALNARDPQVRLGAVCGISLVHDSAAAPAVIDIAGNDRALEVRWAALLALGDLGSTDAIPLCVASLQDRNRYIRYGAAVALGRLLWEPEDTPAWAYYFIALQDWDGLRSLGSAAAGPMKTMLKDDDPDMRIRLIDLLSRTGTAEATDACSLLLKDSRDSVRYWTVLSAIKSGLAADRMPLLLAQRERSGPNPAVAALLNFLFLGIGYNYMGKWWGFLLFMSYMSILVLAQLRMGPFLPYLLAYPVTALFAFQTYREAKSMREMS